VPTVHRNGRGERILGMAARECRCEVVDSRVRSNDFETRPVSDGLGLVDIAYNPLNEDMR
jgi:hypothetical protein